MTEDQIKHMAQRFLCWKLPENFHPDCGISFTPDYNTLTKKPAKHEPSGTNLFDYTQALAMVRHMVDGLPNDLDESRNCGGGETMTAEIMRFPGITKLDTDPDLILREAIGKMENVVVMGFDKDGNEYFAASYADGADALWHARRLEHALMKIADADP